MQKIHLFSEITPEEQMIMKRCLRAKELHFKNGAMIIHPSDPFKRIGIIQSGHAILYYSDSSGSQYVLEELTKESVFGDIFLTIAQKQQYYIMADQDTTVLFIDYDHVIKRCPNACRYHSQMVSNLLQLIAMKSLKQSNRIHILSRATMRDKIFAYLDTLSPCIPGQIYHLPMHYTALAEYLCVDRSALMRALKSLVQEGIILRDGRTITLL